MATRLKLCVFALSTLFSAALGAQPAPTPSAKPAAAPAATPPAAKPAVPPAKKPGKTPAVPETPAPQPAPEPEQQEPEPESGTLAAKLKATPKLKTTTPSNLKEVKDLAKDTEEALGIDCARFIRWVKGADPKELAQIDELVAKTEKEAAKGAAKAEPPKPESEAQKKEREKAKADLDAAKRVKDSFRACTKADTSTLTSSNIGADLVRTVAQVVVDKVQRQGWETLLDKIKELAACPKDEEKKAEEERKANKEEKTAEEKKREPTRYPNLCRVIDTVTIQDLVASPETLLDAVAQDLLSMALESATLNPAAGKALGLFLTSNSGVGAGTALKGIAEAHRFGPEVLLRRLQRILLEKAQNQAGSLACNPTWTSPEQALWVAGMCFIEQPSADALKRCDFSSWVDRCQAPSPDKAEKVLQFLTAAQEVLGRTEGSARAEATIRLVFSMASAQVEETLKPPTATEALEWLAAFEDTLLGLINRDWVRVVSGATRVVSYAIDKKCKDPCDYDEKDKKKRTEVKFLSLVGAIGNYALTYKNKDTEQAQVDREKIMGELVDRMVSRTDKTDGVKFSLGGSLGLLGGVRTPTTFDATQPAFPVQLGLGFGIQSYHESANGFHLMVTALDVGQYVTFDNSELEVEEPDVKAAVTLGLTVGGWGFNRELPWYLAGYFGCSPFVRTQDDSGTEPTFQLGVVTGFYAPLLDFN